MIPAEAVEAAAKVHFERDGGRWDEWTPEEKAVEMEDMRAALEAAAPYMLAEAWKEGESAGQDNAYAYQVGIAVKSNPYRPADAV